MSSATARLWPGLSFFVLFAGAAAAKPAPVDRLGVVPTPIHAIQGSGLASPLVGVSIVTEGIVTAHTHDGFFLQSAPGTEDGDPATSEGLFVFTGTAPVAPAAVGNQLRVTGEVQEFIPAANPHQMPVTRLVAAALDLVSTGVERPGYTRLTPAELAPDSSVDALERYEGMRVNFPSDLLVVGPVEGRYDEVTGVTTATGVYHVVLYGTPRPFRGPGLSVLDVGEPPAGKAIPRHDGHPERLRIDSAGQPGAVLVNWLGAGNFLGRMAGVLHYRDGAYTLLTDPATNFYYGGSSASGSIARVADRQVSLGWMKFRRLFDDRDDPARGEPVMTSAGYDARLRTISRELCFNYGLPDVLAVGGVESLEVLSDLAADVLAHPTCSDPPAYQPVLVDSANPEGLDLGFLVAVRDATASRPRIQVLGAEAIAAEAAFSSPDGTTLPLFAQPPLLLSIGITSQAGQQEVLSVLAVQFLPAEGSASLAAGSLGWDTEGDRVRATRAAQAVFLGQWLDARQLAAPSEMMAVVGGFESDAFNDGHVDVMGLLTGSPAPANETWLAPSLAMARPLANLTLRSSPGERYTLITEGIAHAPDHVLVNAAMESRVSLLSRHARVSSTGAAHGPFASASVRDTLRVDLAPVAFTETDTHLALLSAPAILSPFRDAELSWRLANQGGQTAPQVRMEVRSNLAPGLYELVRPNLAWTCIKTADGGGSRVDCTRATLPAGAIETFRVAIDAYTLPDGTQADFEVTAGGGYVDVDGSDDRLDFSTQFLGSVDVSLRPMVPQAVAYPGEPVAFLVQQDESTNNDPGELTLVATLGARVDEVQLQNGYDILCDPGVDLGDGRSQWTCRTDSWFAGVSKFFRFVVTPAVTDGGREIGFHARISSATPDRDLGNNEVSVVQPISNAGDLAVTPGQTFGFTYALDMNTVLDFDVTTPTAGVSVNPQILFVVDAPPANIVSTTFTGSPQHGPIAWTCGPAQEHVGGRSQIRCTTNGPIRHVQQPARSWLARIVFKSTLVPGLAIATATGSAIATTDSVDRNPDNNTATATAMVDQTTDLRLLNTVQGPPDHEPNDAIFVFGIGYQGRNAARSVHMNFTVDAELEPGQLRVGDSPAVLNNTCVPRPAPAGHTSVRCAITPNRAFQYALVPTRPEWFGRDLTVTATIDNLLVDADESNNTRSVTRRVGARADLCLTFRSTACFGTHELPIAIAPGGTARLPFTAINQGVSTAAGTRIIFDVPLPPGRVAGDYQGQACAPAEAVGGNASRVTCELGDLRGDNTARTVWLHVDGAELTSPGTLSVQARVASDREDPDATNNQVTATIPVRPAVDLRLDLKAVGDGHYLSSQQFAITAGTAGAAALGTVVEVVYEADYLAATPQFASAQWSCFLASSTARSGRFWCNPSVALGPDARTTLVFTFRPTFLQIGRPITVRARHVFGFEATAADPTPDDAQAEARIDVGGRNTQSKSTKTEPTPAYGVRRAITPTPLRPQVRAAARE